MADDVFVDSFDKIGQMMMAALSADANKEIKRKIPIFLARIKERIPLWIAEQPEIASLTAHGVPNSLAAQFGIVPGDEHAAIQKVISVLSESIKVKMSPVDRNFTGGVEFVFDGDKLNLLKGTSEGTVVTEKDTPLDWLDWLLTKGDATIITGYHYVPSTDGRSGGGTMSVGSVWRVPPEFSGTDENNFITRALAHREIEIEGLLQDIMR